MAGKWKWVGAAIQSRAKVLTTTDHLGMAMRFSKFLGLKGSREVVCMRSLSIYPTQK